MVIFLFVNFAVVSLDAHKGIWTPQQHQQQQQQKSTVTFHLAADFCTFFCRMLAKEERVKL
jgi:hypothetical protein